MRIRTLLGIGTVLLGTAGAFAARPHEDARTYQPARIVQPVQEYRNADVRERDNGRDNRDFDRRDFDRHDFDGRDIERHDFRDDHQDRDGRWNQRAPEIVIAPDCR